MENNSRKPFYKKPVWITLITIMGAVALLYEAGQAVNTVFVQASACIDKRIRVVTDTEINKMLKPLKQQLKKDHLNNLKINANLRATMNEEQKNIGAAFFKIDSAVDANSSVTETE